jgi:DNA helicase HerA-like ATPase
MSHPIGTLRPMRDQERQAGPVGRVVGTEDSTPLHFWVALSPERYLQLDDVVICERPLPDDASVTLSGIVTQVIGRQEGAQFASDVFLIADGVLPGEAIEVAEITVSRVEPEIYVPPLPGAPARRAEDAERDHALFFDDMEHRVPIGLGRDGAPLYANLEFLDGTRGAHVNISGISGVATKTSYATFLLYSMFHSGVLGAEAVNTKALIFNVKGEDLLFLDQPNGKLDEEQQDRYRTLGLMPGPFESVAVFAPPRKGDPNAGPDVATRTTGVSTYYWTIADFVEGELLPFVFADAEDERQQYTMVIHNVVRKLKVDGVPFGDDGAWQIEGVTVRTYHELVELIVDRLTDEDSSLEWAGRAVGMGTINAFVRRLLSSQRALGHLIRADVPLRARRHVRTAASAQVTVVDIHNLADRAQRFVVGVTLQREFEQKEESGARRPLLFVVLDELNKYAPREGQSPIKDLLLDIAERGRSLGIILVGAQQTASEVERRVIANSALRVAGRLDPAEAMRPEYGFLPAAHRERARIAKPGTMFVSQPEIPVPLVAEFPFPAWATRPDEVRGGRVDADQHRDADGVEADPFAGLPGA